MPRTSRTLRAARPGDDDGFTLIELLVVIIIIGILAAIAIPVYLNQRNRGYVASEKSDLHTIANEIESYYSDNDDYTNVTFGGFTGAGTTHSITAASGPVYVGSDQMTLSSGNTATLLLAGVNGYCVSISNSHVSNPSGNVWYYDSLGGGLTKTPCAASNHAY